MGLILGSNASVFADFTTAVPAARGRRVYYPEPNAWPKTWPLVGDSVAVVSIRPVPADLLAGKLDGSIRALCESAPGDADLNAWHEAGNLPEYGAPGFSYITPETMTAVHDHMQQLVKGTRVSYGAILCMKPQSMPPWMPGGLDWYGLDIYDWPQFHVGGSMSAPLDIRGALTGRLDEWRATVQHVTGQQSPRLNICETNSDHPSHRGKWFTALAEWLVPNGGHRLLTFWSEAGCGPWLPDDQGTIDALRAISAL
ncbi:MAG TPA: hypothetical protein VF834_23550 [Streptosporangiaceae bacterium]